jgi:hypothetical protein
MRVYTILHLCIIVCVCVYVCVCSCVCVCVCVCVSHLVPLALVDAQSADMMANITRGVSVIECVLLGLLECVLLGLYDGEHHKRC